MTKKIVKPLTIIITLAVIFSLSTVFATASSASCKHVPPPYRRCLHDFVDASYRTHGTCIVKERRSLSETRCASCHTVLGTGGWSHCQDEHATCGSGIVARVCEFK